MSENPRRYKRVITFGTYDLFHIGHLNILERAKALGEKLIVGISTDALNLSKKNVYPVYGEQDRLRIVQALACVDEVFFEHSLELKKQYIVAHQADCLVMGDDWAGKFDWCHDVCEVVYLERTPNVSTTEVKEEVVRMNLASGNPEQRQIQFAQPQAISGVNVNEQGNFARRGDV